MAYDHQEQEQLETFKAYWAKYGNLVTWVLIVALGAYAGWTYWKNHRVTKAVEASALYDELQQSLLANDNARTQRVAGDIRAKYEDSTYAQMAALGAAKTAFEANDLKTTKAQLQWVLDHGNDEFKAIARVRLAGVLLDEKAYDAALKALDGKFPAAFEAEANERRGDVLVAQNKLDEARKAYVAALAVMPEQHPGRQLVQVKLEAIGGSAPSAAKADTAAKAAA